MATAKIQLVNGLRVEIFSRTLRKNTTRPLTRWIGGTVGIGILLLCPKNLLKSTNELCLRLLIIFHLGYALRVTKYSFGRWYIDER